MIKTGQDPPGPSFKTYNLPWEEETNNTKIAFGSMHIAVTLGRTKARTS